MIKIKVEELIKIPASDILGKVIVFPTDTVYGIGALCNDLDGIKKIYELKHRDKSKPLACLAADVEDIMPVININNERTGEFIKYWPGAITLIFEKKDRSFIDESLSTIAFRIPNLFRRLFGEGALGAAFIPVFHEIENEELEEF